MDDIELQSASVSKRDVRRESVSAEQVGANTVSTQRSAREFFSDDVNVVYLRVLSGLLCTRQA